jgi:iron complex outermembrane receptor protein
MSHPRFHPAPLALAVALVIATLGTSAVHAQSAATLPAGTTFDISLSAQPLGTALNELARQAKLQLMVHPDLVAGKSAPAVSGNLTARQALDRLLMGSGLTATMDGSAVVVRTAPVATRTTTLPAVTVTANAERETAIGPVNGYVARLSRTATKTDTALLETPQSISVIGREEMEARGVQDVTEAIRYTPGVTVDMWGPDSRGIEWIMLRGFSTYSDISYRDGLSQADFGNLYPLTEPYGLERVEVLRGPSSVAFGQGDAGGIINRVSKVPTGERIREVQVQYGSFDRKQLAFDLGDKIAGRDDLSFRVVGLGLDSNFQEKYPDGTELNHTRQYLAPSFTWKPSAATSLTVLGEVLRNRAADNINFVNDASGGPTKVKIGDPTYSRIDQDQAAIGYAFAHRFNDQWELRQNFRYTDYSGSKRRLFGALQADGRTFSRTAQSWIDSMNQTALDTQLEGRLNTGSVEHKLLFGTDLNRLKGDEQNRSGAAPSLDLINPVYGISIPEPQTLLASYKQTTNRFGIYAQDQMKLGERWIVTLGGRQDRVETKTQDLVTPANSSSQSASVFSGRAGLSYLLGNGWAPYVSYAESFLPSAGMDADSNPFKPSRGKQTEVGIKFQPSNSKTLFTAALFDLRKTNVVTYDATTYAARQIGAQRSRGLELEAKTELTRGLNALASFTVLDMKVLQSANTTEIGKTPIQVPKKTVSVWLDYMTPSGVGVGGGVRYIGKRWNDVTNTSAEPSVTLVDSVIHYDTGPWRLALNISNLFDKKYYASRAYSGYYYGAERTVTMTARYRW